MKRQRRDLFLGDGVYFARDDYIGLSPRPARNRLVPARFTWRT
jgi:hypothetical protein